MAGYNSSPTDSGHGPDRPQNIAPSVYETQVRKLDSLRDDLNTLDVSHDLTLDDTARIAGTITLTNPDKARLAAVSDALTCHGCTISPPNRTADGEIVCHVNRGSR